MEKREPKQKKPSRQGTPVWPGIIPPIIDQGMASGNDPQGSYTGVPIGNPYETPVQDADDL